MPPRSSKSKLWTIGTISGIASIVGVPLSIALWYFTSPPAEDANSMSSSGNNSAVVAAGRDAVIGDSPRPREPEFVRTELEGTSSQPSRSVEPGRMASAGDNSPVVIAGRDAIINVAPPRADFVTAHDGAGALMMTEPDFKTFVSSSMRGRTEKVVGRLVNGTEVAQIELLQEAVPPWAKVRVLEGDFKDQEGWILMNSLKKPD